MRQALFIVMAALLCFLSCSKDKLEILTEEDQALERAIISASETRSLNHFTLPESNDLQAIPQDPQNPLSFEKIELGKLLFYETGLALAPFQSLSEQTWSCATCHVPDAGFRPGAMQGIADGGLGFGVNGEDRFIGNTYLGTDVDAQGARPLSLLNVAYVTNTLWNGQFGAGGVNEGTEHLWDEIEGLEVNHLGLSGMEAQIIEGLHLHRMVVNKEVLDEYGYTELFDECFSEIAVEKRYTDTIASFALSAYLRSLITNEAPFQKWLKGDKEALTQSEKRGAMLFFGKANCASCHRGPSFNAMNFYALGVNDLWEVGGVNTGPDDTRNLGRGGFTGEEEDMFKFKVPQLYNLSDSPFYFHGSSKYSLEEVIDYFDNAIPENDRVPAAQIAPNFQPLSLTGAEKADLLNFISNSLNDPNLERYVPDEVLSGNCIPNNDPFSKLDIGCE